MLQKLIMLWLRMATYWPFTGLVENISSLNDHVQNTSARRTSSVVPSWIWVLLCRACPHRQQPRLPTRWPRLRRLADQLQRQRLLQEPHCEPQCPISFSLLTQITSTAPSGTSPGGRWGQWFVAAPEKTSLLDFFPRTCPLWCGMWSPLPTATRGILFHNSGNSYTTDKSHLHYFDNFLWKLFQAPGGWTLPGNERSICDALNLS